MFFSGTVEHIKPKSGQRHQFRSTLAGFGELLVMVCWSKDVNFSAFVAALSGYVFCLLNVPYCISRNEFKLSSL